ncbi:unnamed protein product [Prunus brigantina]
MGGSRRRLGGLGGSRLPGRVWAPGRVLLFPNEDRRSLLVRRRKGDMYILCEKEERKKGLLELYNWLQGHLPANMTVDHEMYFVECVDFAKSFIQLYIKEDDVLFKVLLHLLRVPCSAEHKELIS